MRRFTRYLARLYRHWVLHLPYLSLPALRAAEPDVWTHAYISPAFRAAYVGLCLRDQRTVNTLVMAKTGLPAWDYCGKPLILNQWGPGLSIAFYDREWGQVEETRFA